MSRPPIPLPEIHESILAAFRDLNEPKARHPLAEVVSRSPDHITAHLTLEHTIPGPSSVTKCRRAQWLPTHTDDDGEAREDWAYAAMIGVAVEPLWHLILGHADPRLVVSDFAEPLDIAPGVIGMPDGALEQIGSLLELKASGSWDFVYTNEDGLFKNHMDHVAQTNLYMDAADVDWCLIIHNTVAPSWVRWQKAKWIRPAGEKPYKDPDFRYPFFTLNWVHRDPEYVAELKERLVVLQGDQANDEPAPREFNPWTTKFPGQRMCRWREQCEAVG